MLNLQEGTWPGAGRLAAFPGLSLRLENAGSPNRWEHVMSLKAAKVLPGQAGGQRALAKFIDYAEGYGPHVIARFVRSLPKVEVAVDLGAGAGRDLTILKSIHPAARTHAVEAGKQYAQRLVGKVDEIYTLNIERDALPFADCSVDLFIANQVIEHTKEVFWIFHEVSRCLKIGGNFIFGVPNIASLHNRLLLVFGRHPTQHKMISAHVRPFSKADTLLFLSSCYPGGYELVAFAGSQFYPLPPWLARVAAAAFPEAAFSIFFMIRKNLDYLDEFARYPSRAQLETNFWTGNIAADSQY
jgi:SAM-dependent methyltransferase